MNICLADRVMEVTMIVKQVVVVRIPQLRPLWLTLGVCHLVNCGFVLFRCDWDRGKACLVVEAVAKGGHYSII